MSLKIFIVEDHPVMRSTLSGFIQNKPGLEVVGVAATGAEALERLAEVEADLSLIDVRLPGMSGLKLVEQLRERYPNLLCLMLSGHGEIPYIRHAFREGAQGYVLKGKPSEILEAIQAVSSGGTYLSPTLQSKLLEIGGTEG
jgi:DNA-binding NarL/FixJ family response regulator